MRLSDIDVRQLRVFLGVVECGGFSAAESVLGISQSTISTHIAELERRLGYRLCERGRHGFQLSERGRDLHAQTLKLVQAFAEFEDTALSLRGAIAGRLRLALIDNLITDPGCPIPGALKALGRFKCAPRISIDVLSPAEIELAVASGRADCGVTIAERKLPSLSYTRLYEERDVLVCGRDHPLFGVDDETALRTLLTDTPKVVRSFLNHHDFFLISDREASITATVDSVEAAAHLILAGTHVGFLPHHYAALWTREGTMRALLPDELSRASEIVLVEKAGETERAPAVVTFLSAITEATGGQSGAPMRASKEAAVSMEPVEA